MTYHARFRLRLLVGLMLACELATACGGSTPRDAERTAKDTTTTPVGARWDTLANSPLSDRRYPVLVWTSLQLLVFAGEQSRDAGRRVTPLNDGAVFDPASGRWRTIARPPFDPPLFRPSGYWTGTRMLVVGTRCDNRVPSATEGVAQCYPGDVAAATYDPAHDRWERVAVPPALPENPGGEEAIRGLGWTGSDAVFVVGTEYWAYHPSQRQWRRMPDPPLAPGEFCASPVGLALFSMVLPQLGGGGTSPSIAPPGPQPLTIKGAVLDPRAGQWSTVLPAQPAQITGTGNIICAGGTALFHSGVEATARSFDSRVRSWQTAAPPPSETGVVEGELWTGRETVVFGEGGPVGYEPAANRWRRLSPTPIGRPNTGIWTADRAVLVDFDTGAPRLNLSAYVPIDG